MNLMVNNITNVDKIAKIMNMNPGNIYQHINYSKKCIEKLLTILPNQLVTKESIKENSNKDSQEESIEFSFKDEVLKIKNLILSHQYGKKNMSYVKNEIKIK